MSTTVSFTIEKPFSKKIDELISRTGLYQSKSEFLRDAAREKLYKILELEPHLKAVEASKKRLQKKARFNKMLSQKERDELAREHLKNL